MGKLTIGDAVTKKAAIEAQINAVWLPYRGLPPADAAKARMAADRLVADKLALLRPQWAQEEAEKWLATSTTNSFAPKPKTTRALRRNYSASAPAAGTCAAASASMPKTRRRPTPSPRFARNTTTPASNGRPGSTSATASRWRLRSRPPTRRCRSRPCRLKSGGPAAAPPDFAADVKAAADLAVKREENSYKFDKKQINQTLMANTDAVIDLDLARLKARYDALVPKRGAENLPPLTCKRRHPISRLSRRVLPRAIPPAAGFSSRCSAE